MSERNAPGFSFIELVVSMAITLVITASMFGFVHAARTTFELDIERADMQQRTRVSIDALFRDLIMAGAGLQVPAIAPYRRGTDNPDLPGSAFSDRVSVRFAFPDSGAVTTATYALRTDAAGVPQLSRYDGHASELPVVDQISALRFEYFDAIGQEIAITRFTDGPWVTGAGGDPFDADLLVVRRVRVTVRVRPARTLVGFPIADLQSVIDVSPRNLNLQWP